MAGKKYCKHGEYGLFEHLLTFTHSSKDVASVCRFHPCISMEIFRLYGNHLKS